ncbi:hypothetical protein M406DRAFT_334558 [Cryphonectria parasitica EP155]|uniref:Uncharacterized protein n=1 Tax=Cryphonectria parasitica (strain ATCC 38755 / EP155) TaxID=660469 RepID=A0A9P5CK89_CRYP1|nr:uncharacterized protein M406DRAFT_334558 [Cryphonectria parasitica EP155]KAF3760937.1 hypothetical protein M406DRAFT_334558 [Cryphonectria parasitica EP155]
MATGDPKPPLLIPDVFYEVARTLRPGDILSLMLTCGANYHILRKLIYIRDVEIEAETAEENHDLVSGYHCHHGGHGDAMKQFPYAAPYLLKSTESALDWAIRKGDVQVARLAVEAGSTAVLNTGISRLRSIIPGSRMQFLDKGPKQPTPSPLALAAAANNLEIFKMIQPGVPEREATVTLPVLDLSIPFDIMEAAIVAGSVDIVDYLLKGPHSEAFIQAWPEGSMWRYVGLAVETTFTAADVAVVGLFLDRFPDLLSVELGFNPILQQIFREIDVGDNMILVLDLLEERGLALDTLDINNTNILHRMLRDPGASVKVKIHLVQKGVDFWTPRGPKGWGSGFAMAAMHWYCDMSLAQRLSSISLIRAMVEHEQHGKKILPEQITSLIESCFEYYILWPESEMISKPRFPSDGTLDLDFLECLLGHEGVCLEAHLINKLRWCLAKSKRLDKYFKSTSSTREEAIRRILLKLDALSK